VDRFGHKRLLRPIGMASGIPAEEVQIVFAGQATQFRRPIGSVVA